MSINTIYGYVGDHCQWLVEFVDDDGNGMDITGHTLQYLFSKRRLGPVLLSKAVTVHASPCTGSSYLALSPEEVTTLGGAGRYWLTIIDINTVDQEQTREIRRLIIYNRAQIP